MAAERLRLLYVGITGPSELILTYNTGRNERDPNDRRWRFRRWARCEQSVRFGMRGGGELLGRFDRSVAYGIRQLQIQ